MSTSLPREGGKMHIRPAHETEIDRLAEIWHEGWRDAHATIMPPELARERTPGHLADKLRAALPNVRVAGAVAEPAGFCMLKDDELYQLYVARSARGTGVAAALVADAEARIAETGAKTAWLACAVGNDRAARFYEKCGWRRTGVVGYSAETSQGSVPLQVWRYEKRLDRR